VAKPRTVKERVRNAGILQEFNAGHVDDLFESSKAPKAKSKSAAPLPSLPAPPNASSPAKTGPKAILNDLFGSDSENDISMHSARTPIGNYIKPTNRRPSNILRKETEKEEEEEEAERPLAK